MKTIGVLGGMSWESTAVYYRALNEATRESRGGLHSAPIVLYSLDFAPIEALQHAGDWDGAAQLLVDAAQAVTAAGAELLLIATNTMHRVAQIVEDAVDIPLLHIADATGEALTRDGVSRVGLLGTAFTMEQAFYRDRLQRHGVQVLTPGEADRAIVHQVIYEELCVGRVAESSRQAYLRIIDDLAAAGAEGVVLGCTEIGMLVRPGDTSVRLYDTTELHAAAAVARALQA